jgi:tape measure domain-containing protein
MADIATLGIKVDTSQVKSGSRDLDNLAKSGKRAEDATNGLTKGFGLLKSVVASVGIAYVAKQFIDTADSMQLLDARLRLVTDSTNEFNEARSRLIALSAENRSGLEENVKLYTRLAPSVKEAGGGVAETMAIVDAFSKTLKISGANTAEATASTLQFAQAMGSGKLAGDEFRAMAETSPRFLKALADSLGLPVGKLKELAKEGKLTADVVGNALIKQRDNLAKEFASLPVTVADQMQLVKNEVSLAINDINKGAGITVSLGGVIESLRGLIPVIRDELAGAAISVTSWFGNMSDELSNIYEQAGGVVSEVWEMAKGLGSVLGFLTEILVKSEALQFTFYSIRLLIAGFQDGLKIFSAAFAKLGQGIMLFFANFYDNLGKAASALGLSVGERLKGIAGEIRGVANNAGKAADDIFNQFARGDTAVARMNNSFEDLNGSVQKVAKSSEKLKSLKAIAGGDDGEADKKKANEIKRLTRAIENLGVSEFTRVQRLQQQFNALTGLNAKESERLQILLNQARAQEVLDAFNEAADEGNKNASEIAEDEMKEREDLEKRRADGYTDIWRELDDEYEDLNTKMIKSDRDRAKEQLRIEHERSLRRIADLGLESEQAQDLIEKENDVYKKRLEEMATSSKFKADEITEFWKEAARNMQDAMSDFFFDVMEGRLGDFEKSFTSAINRMVANLMASQLSDFLFGKSFGKDGELGGVFGNVFGGAGDFFGDLFGGFFANGGMPPMGKVSVVGENGPELFVPKSAGTIVPNSQMQQGITIKGPLMVVNTPDADSFNKSDKQIAAKLQQRINMAQRIR